MSNEIRNFCLLSPLCTDIDPDTAAQYSIYQVRKIFLDSNLNSYAYQKENWADDQLQITLNFFDASYLSPTPIELTHELVRAWEVHSQKFRNAVAYVSDEDGNLSKLHYLRID